MSEDSLPRATGTIRKVKRNKTYEYICEIALHDGRVVRAIPTTRSRRARLEPREGMCVTIALSPFDTARGYLLGPGPRMKSD